jgi:predicted negative regulator of RcsB-dependent stress response
MPKHPTSSRVHREDQVPDDAFVSTVKGIIAWSRENSRQLVIAGVVTAAVVLAAFWYINEQRSVEARATSRFTAVQQSVLSGNTQLAIRDLQSFIGTFGGTETGNQARLILADILLAEDQAQEAIEALGSLPDDFDQPFGLPAARVQAAALEEAGDVDDAVSTYLRVADNARFEFQRREALADAARVRMQNGDADAAADLYERVLETFDEQEPGRGYYEMWLAEARSMAREGAGTAPTTPDSATNG